MAKKKKNVCEIEGFDWEMLVGAWRYYEHRSTISASMFPEDIIRRYFSGKYSDDTCERIAVQFANIDHGIRGVKDWHWNEDDPSDDWMREYHPWLKFYAFCKGYANGFSAVGVEDEKTQEIVDVKSFYLETTGRWYPVDEYIREPHFEIYIPKDLIKTCFPWSFRDNGSKDGKNDN